MTTLTKQYSAAAEQARNAVVKTADFWTQGARTVADWIPGLPQVDLVPAVERYFDFVQRTVDMNHNLAVKWAEAAGTLSGTARDKAGSAAEVAADKAESAGDAVREQADAVEQSAFDQAMKAEQVLRDQSHEAEARAHQAELDARAQARQAEQDEEELAREARRVERLHARQAHQKAKERYEGLTKAELSDRLAQRGLPKSGNGDDPIARQVSADGK